jgi:hypothetical protein
MPIDWGLLIVTAEKGIALEMSYSDARLLVTFLWGFSYCGIKERVFMFDYDTKEKEDQNSRQSDFYSGATPPRTNQIASCFDAFLLLGKLYIQRFLRNYMCITKLP